MSRPDRAVDRLVDSMLKRGVRHVMGIPGGSIMPLFDALYFTEDIQVVLFKHEQGAVHAAEAYGRIARRPGIAAVTSGPGATNVVTGVANAFMDSAPLIVLTGQVPTSMFGRDAFQETDIVGVVSPITKFAYLVKDPNELVPAFNTAYEISIMGRPGPTLLDLPRDVQLASSRGGEGRIRVNYEKFMPPMPNKEDILKAVKLLLEAERPVILVGGGAYWSGATNEVIALAEMLGAPIVSTFPGKNAIPHNHPLYMGPSGMHGRLEADAALANADVILAVGTRFSDRTVGRFKELAEKRIIHIDVDRSEVGKNVKPAVSIIADAAIALREMISYMPNGMKRNEEFLAWLKWIRARFEEALEKWEREFTSFAPWKVMKMLRRIMPPDSITVTGVGSHQMWAELHWDVYVPGTFITSAGLGTMGFCVPAALGAKLAAPDRPVLCIDGDGSFQMTMNNLSLVRDYNLPIIVVVFDNRALMLVKQWQIYMYSRRIIATEFSHRPDFLKIAEAYEIEAVRPSTYEELGKAVEWALRNNEPIVVDVTLDNNKDIVLPWVKPGDWLTDAVKPPGMDDVELIWRR